MHLYICMCMWMWMWICLSLSLQNVYHILNCFKLLNTSFPIFKTHWTASKPLITIIRNPALDRMKEAAAVVRWVWALPQWPVSIKRFCHYLSVSATRGAIGRSYWHPPWRPQPGHSQMIDGKFQASLSAKEQAHTYTHTHKHTSPHTLIAHLDTLGWTILLNFLAGF